MKFFLFSLAFFLALLIEVTIWQIPLVLLLLLMVVVVYRTEWVFPLALFLGLILDMLSFRTIGGTSIFFVVCLLLVFLYEQKFELQTMPFVAFISFFASTVYFLLFGSTFLFLQVILSIFISIGLFMVFSFIHPRPAKDVLPSWKK